MSDLLAEVDEIMRQERIVDLWKAHGNKFIAIIAAIILTTAAVSGYKHWNNSVQERDTATLVAALENQDFPENITAESLDIRPSLKAIGLLSAAGAYLQDDNQEKALALYQAIENESSTPDDLKALAIIKAIDLETVLNGTSENAQKRLQSIWADQSNPWAYHAHLKAAALYALEGNYEEAQKHLDSIVAAQGLPPELYQKADALQKIYTEKSEAKTHE